jgi:hypothetical protein
MSTRWRATALVCAALSGALCAGSVQAQDLAASATDLFKRGLDDMLAGKFETGCPALANSYVLDPRLGTLFTVAECENKAGRFGSATRHYRQYLRLFAELTPELRAKQKGREAISAEALMAIEPRAAKLTLVLPADAPPGTVVKRDGELVEGTAFGQPMPVDAGEHLLTVLTPGQPAKEIRLTLGAAESKQVVIELPARAQPEPTPVIEPTPEDPPDDGSTMRTAGLITGGVGLAALAAGAITGGLAMSEHGTAKDNCDGTVCNQEGLDAIDQVRPLGNASTALFVVGGVGVAAGVLLFVLAPSEQTEEATASRGIVVRPWVGGTSELGAVTGLQGAW